MKIINRRYRILDNLDKDNTGEVFRAVDLMNHERPVLLKLFNKEYSKGETVRVFIEEFIHWKSVQHSYIDEALTFEILTNVDNRQVNASQYFYTAELHETGDLVEHFQLTREEMQSVVIQLCQAIQYLHFRGFNYRYLCIDNMQILKRDSRVVLKLKSLPYVFHCGDIAKHTGDQSRIFLAPETTWNNHFHPASDIYAMGYILYFLYYRKEVSRSTIDQLLKSDEDNSMLRLIRKATSSMIENRHSNIEAFIQDAFKILRLEYSFADKGTYEILQRQIPLVGSKKAIAEMRLRVKERLERRSKFNAYRIFGQSGLGKGRLLEEIEYKLQMDKYHVIKQELNREWDEPFGAFKHILSKIVYGERISYDLIQKYGPELVKLFPELRERWDVQPSSVLGDDKEHLRLANRLYNFLAEYALESPFVLVVDNSEYLSRFETTILEFLMCDERDIPFYLILSCGGDTSHNWTRHKSMEHHQLTPFTYEEAASFVVGMLGVKQPHMVLTTELMKVANGSPLRIQNLMQALFDNGYLFITDQRGWAFQPPSNLEQFESSLSRIRTSMDILKDRSDEEQDIINVMSIFNEPVNVQIITGMLEDMDDERVDQGMRSLVRAGILNEKFNDWGYTYDFINLVHRTEIYSALDKERRIALHRLAASNLENLYQDHGRHMSGPLIHHLIQSEQEALAIEYCMVAAEEMEHYGIYMQAIDFYEKAVQLHQRFEHERRIPELLYHIGRIKWLLGAKDEAGQYFQQAKRIAIDNGMQERQLDAEIQLAAIAVENHELSAAYTQLEACKQQAAQIGYENGEFEAVYWLIILYDMTGEFDGFVKLLPAYASRAQDSENDFYLGRFYNEYGVWKTNIGVGEEAPHYFKKSIYHFKQCGNRLEEAKVLNNLGVYFLNVLGDVSKSRECFIEAQMIVSDVNVVQGEATYVMNLAESYLLEDKYELAIEHLNNALQSSERGQSKGMYNQVMTMLAQTYLSMNDYKRAQAILNKLELEFQETVSSPKEIVDYYSLQIEFELMCRRFDQAGRMVHMLQERIAGNRQLSGLQIDLAAFFIDTLRLNSLQYNKQFDEKALAGFAKQIDGPMEAKAFRRVAQYLCKMFICSKKFVQAKRLLDLDAQVSQVYSTEVFVVKHEMLSAVYSEDRQDVFERLLRAKDKYIYPEDRWFLYYLLAEVHTEKGQIYQALTNYLSSLEVIRDLTYQLSEDRREHYLLFDQVKAMLKTSINSLYAQIVGERSIDEFSLRGDRDYSSVEEYFEVAGLQALYENEHFLESIYAMYQEKYVTRMQRVEDLIVNLKKDELSNLHTILLFCVQRAVADRGCLYLVDETGMNTEVIKLTADEDVPDLSKVLGILGHDDNGIVVNKMLDIEKHRVQSGQKSMLLLPIHEPGDDGNAPMARRKMDYQVKHAGVTGYLYLDSGQVFNRFSEETLDELRKLRSMLYMMIDNYNMKRLSTIDKLTGVYLRKHMEERFALELAASRHENRNLSVIMCDIDKFKLINDQYGHRKGDDVLRKIGAELKLGLRDTDLVGRYGGEEFIVLLPDTDQSEAMYVCEKLRTRIMEHVYVSKDHPITISLGIATYPSHGLNEEELIERADQALYCSKNNGRNQTTLWNQNIGQDKSRFDKLAGILTGNISNDTRNVQAMVDIVDLLRSGADHSVKLYQLITTLLDITEATAGSLVELEDGEVKQIWSREKGCDGWQDLQVDLEMVRAYKERDSGDYFINWNDIGEIDAFSGTPNWKSIIVMPLSDGGVQKGQIHLSVPIAIKEFDFRAFNFVNSISSVALRLL